MTKHRYIEGQFLLRYSGNRYPLAFGDKKFTVDEVGMANESTAVLRKELRVVSPIIKRFGKNCFGSEDNWKKTVNDDGPIWNMIDPDREIDIDFSDEALEGIYYCLYRSMHPYSDAPATMAEIDEIVNPIIEKTGWSPRLREALGLKAKRVAPK